jgi:myo-inositol 2-dehydrogenase/D-chiro-inositol 1-dehydrogenase
VRIGLIGAGRIGTVHGEVLRDLDAVDALVIGDIIPEHAVRLADHLGATSTDDPLSLFDDVDALVIASSTDTHVDYLIHAAKSGLPTFCEKPIALDVASTMTAIEAVEGAGITVLMGFMRRFDPGYRQAHRRVAGGALGEVLLVKSYTHDPEPPHEAYIAVSGGAFKDMLIHDIDVVRYVTGREFIEVQAGGSNRTMEVFARYDDLAVVSAIGFLDDESLALMVGCRRDPLGYDVRMEVLGTEDGMAVGPPLDGPLPAGWMDRFGDAYRAEMEYFVRLVVEDLPSPCTPHDALAALLVAEACGESARTGRRVQVRRR